MKERKATWTRGLNIVRMLCHPSSQKLVKTTIHPRTHTHSHINIYTHTDRLTPTHDARTCLSCGLPLLAFLLPCLYAAAAHACLHTQAGSATKLAPHKAPLDSALLGDREGTAHAHP